MLPNKHIRAGEQKYFLFNQMPVTRAWNGFHKTFFKKSEMNIFQNIFFSLPTSTGEKNVLQFSKFKRTKSFPPVRIAKNWCWAYNNDPSIFEKKLPVVKNISFLRHLAKIWGQLEPRSTLGVLLYQFYFWCTFFLLHLE